jgi:hypothetical protein
MPELAVLVTALDRLLEASARVVLEERTGPIERRLERDLAVAFRAEGRAFLRGFRNLADPAKWPLDEPQWMRYLVEAQAETLTLYTAALGTAIEDALMAGVLTAAEAMPEGAPVGESLQEGGWLTRIAGWLAQQFTVLFGIRFDLKNPRAVAYLEAHGAELVRNIDETTRDYIRTVLVEGASKGWSYGEMARRISGRYKEFAVGRPQLHIDSRAHMIAVTEVGNAYAEGNLQVAQGLAAAGLKMEKSWHTRSDDRTEAICLDNEAEGWIPLEQTFSSGHMRPLAHPACLPAGQVVAAQGITGASQRFFDGELVVIHTAGGKELSCTPNHPVLTPYGWVGAGKLNEGEQVVTGNVRQALVLSLPGLQDVHMPARIEQVVDALRLSGKFLFRPVEVTAPDFHGDGSGSQVAVIGTDGALGDKVDAMSREKVAEYDLVGPYIRGAPLARKSREASFGQRCLATLVRLVRSFRVSNVLLGRAVGHHQPVCFEGAAEFDSGSPQALGNRDAGNAIGRGEGVLGLASKIAGDHLLGGDKAAAPTFAVDTVVRMRRKSFKGHVYNLQTDCGYYITSGIVVHNCRCFMQTQRVGAGQPRP